MFENMIEYLKYQGYKTIKTNIEGISVNVLEQEKESFVVVVFNMNKGSEFREEQYHHLLTQVKQVYCSKSENTSRLLSLICTKNVAAVKGYCTQDQIAHWIVDEEQNRLIIYENQPQTFFNLRDQLEQILVGKIQVLPSRKNMKRKKKIRRRSKGEVKRKITYMLKNMPICTVSLIIINVIVFLLVEATGSSKSTKHMIDCGAAYYPYMVGKGQYYRMVTSMFLHFGWDHLFNNMLMLGLLGERFERIVGRVRFLIVYLVSGILGGVGSIVYYVYMRHQDIVSAGASGAIFGIIGGVVALVILNNGRLEEITPLRMLLFLILTIGGGLRSSGVDNAAHITGCLVGLIITMAFYNLKRKSGRIRR